VDAGGAHEALIGIGYAGGPAFGLAATYAASSGWTGSIGSDNLLLIGVGVLSVGTATVVFRRVHKHLNSP
jgi:LPXTG-motif cell wall-anchored protein